MAKKRQKGWEIWKIGLIPLALAIVLLILLSINSGSPEKGITGETIIGGSNTTKLQVTFGESNYDLSLPFVNLSNAIININEQNTSLLEEKPFTIFFYEISEEIGGLYLIMVENLYISKESVPSTTRFFLFEKKNFTGDNRIYSIGEISYNLSISPANSTDAEVKLDNQIIGTFTKQTSPYNISEIADGFNLIIDEIEFNNDPSDRAEVFVGFYISLAEVLGDCKCCSNWTALSTTCATTETFVTYYNDTKACGTDIGRPANITGSCDFDKNGLIGDEEAVDVTRVSLEVNIANATLDATANYTGVKAIELLDINNTIVEFDWDFSSPLDFGDIDIEKQSDTSNVGYLIVNGLEIDKTVFIDQVLNSGQVCVKDADVASVTGVSSSCTGTNETKLSCPGSNGTYTCELSGTRLKISGIMHSAVVELTDNVTACAVNWSCTDWSPCVDSVQERFCVDLNNCGTNVSQPPESQVCACEPLWICTAWEPAECPSSEERTRTCDDRNNCGTIVGKPSEAQTCEYEPPVKTSTIIIIIVALLVIGIIVAIIIYFLNKKAAEAAPPAAAGVAPPTPPAPTAPVPPTPTTAPTPAPPPKPVSKPVQMKQRPMPTPKPAPRPPAKPIK